MKTKKDRYKTARIVSEQYGFVAVLQYVQEMRAYLVRTKAGTVLLVAESDLDDFCM